jgi:prolyl oligopeptidase
MSVSYPTARRDTCVEEFHGHKSANPYVWLEGDDDTPEKTAWLDAQERLFDDVHGSRAPTQRKATLDQLTAWQNHAKYGVPFQRGSFALLLEEFGPCRISRCSTPCVGVDAPDTDAVVVSRSEHACRRRHRCHRRAWRSPSAARFRLRRDALGQRLADDSCASHRSRLARVSQLADALEWVKFSSIAWSHDNAGFFYARYPQPVTKDAGTETPKLEHHRVYYHRVGLAQSEDVLVAATPAEPEWMFGVEVSDDGKTLVVTVSKDCEPSNQVWLYDIAGGANALHLRAAAERGWPVAKTLISEFGHAFNYITNDGDVRFGSSPTTPRRSTRSCASMRAAGSSSMRDVVPQGADLLEGVICVAQNRLVLQYL